MFKKQKRFLPGEQISDQCNALQCWAGSLDSLESVGETHRPAVRQKKIKK